MLYLFLTGVVAISHVFSYTTPITMKLGEKYTEK